MAFDLGFNARATAIYVTDAATDVPLLGEAYPNTYTNGNGDSINAGWGSATGNKLNQWAANDPRIAGYNYAWNDGGAMTFTIDLSSGSAPGTGDYSIDLAIGGDTYKADFKVLDNATVLIDGTFGGAGGTLAEHHQYDATLTDVTATTTWTGTPVTKTFASTTAKVVIAVDNIGSYTLFRHFRLTKQEGGGPATPTRRLTVRGA